MAITFPNSPSSGDTHTTSNGLQYTYDGEKWTTIGTNSAGTWTRSGTTVSLTTAGDDLNVDSGTLFVDASTDRVGVGTSSPQRPLHVDGTEGAARFTSTNSGNNGFEVGIGTSSQAFLWQSENAYMQFATNNAERMRIDSDGRLLLGLNSTIGSNALLQIQGSGNRKVQFHQPDSGQCLAQFTNSVTGNGATDGFLIGLDSTEDVMIWQLENQNLTFGTADTERMRITSSGNVGIGTSSPNKPLHIFSGSSDAEIRLQTNSGTEQNSYITLRQSSGDVDLYTVSSGSNMKFHTVNTERMRIDSSGRLLVGTTAARTAGAGRHALLQVKSPAATTSDTEVIAAKFQGNSTVGDSQCLIACSAGYSISANDTEGHALFGAVREGNGNAAGFIVKTGTSNAERLRITSGGNFQITDPNNSTGLKSKISFVSESPYQDEVAYVGFQREATSEAPCSMVFATGQASGASERMRILSGGGLTFNGDTAQANALDDYEEGTWTPTTASASSVTYTRQSGKYTKIGNTVYIWFDLMWSAMSGTNNPAIGGLPYTSTAASTNGGYGAPQFRSQTGIGLNNRIYGNSSYFSTDRINVFEFNSSGSEGYSSFNSSGRVSGAGFYFVN